MATTFRAALMLPGLLPVDHASFAHPCYVDFAEVSINPFAPPANTSTQGTSWHFPVTGTSPGVDPKGFSATHFDRAWKINGWESIRFEGTVQIATDVGRDTNASPYTPAIAFDILLEGSIPDKYMADSIDISTGTVAAATVAHLGESGNPELRTNANMAGSAGSLGPWTFFGLTDTPTNIGAPVTVKTINTYSGIDGTPGTATLVCQFSASIVGNSMAGRYDKDGDWMYPNEFFVMLIATLGVTGLEPDHIFEGPDGSTDPDNSPVSPAGTSVFCSTAHSVVSGDSDNTSIGQVTFVEPSLTPDPEVFQDETDQFYAVPWLYNDQTEDDGPYNAAEWADVVITVDQLREAIPPDLFP